MSFTEQPILLGESPVIDALRADIQSAARTHAKVLITGETGVGKEVVARLIHNQSARSRQPFMAVNCSGIPETLLASELFGHARGSFTGAYRDKVGLIRQADRGTLFLDELGEMSLGMQATLLRFAETGEIQTVGADGPGGRADVRLITATNRDLRDQIAAGEFREDLYYRLNVIHIRIPPLRERGRDVVLLFRHFLKKASEAHRLPPPDLTTDAEHLILSYQWPGNVRELRNVTERIALRDSNRPITPADLPAEVRAGERATAADRKSTRLNSCPLLPSTTLFRSATCSRRPVRRTGCRRPTSRQMRSTSSSRISGRATCASCGTSPNELRFAIQTGRSRRPICQRRFAPASG